VNPLGAASAVGGRFRLIEPVRSSDPDGAWRAADEDTGAEVAIKPLGAYLAGDAVAQARFRHAARAVLQLSAPGIAQVRDYGESSLPGSRVLLYLVRDLAGGQTLDQRLSGGPLPAGEALRVAASVAAALEAAHQAGVPHGHLVPANIVLGGAGTVTVTDFGLPAPRNDHAGAGDRAGLSYLAPELGDGGPATPAADMYALGVVFVACLAGIGSATARPHAPEAAGSTAPGALAQEQEPVPAAIAALWASCLGPDPKQRPTASRAVALSRQVLSSQARANGRPEVPPAPVAEPAPHSPGPHPAGSARRRYAQRIRGGLATRGSRMAGAGAAAALVAVVAGAAFLVSSLNAQPAAHISSATATGPPSTGAPSAGTHASSGPAGGAPGTDGNGQLASPPATSPAVPSGLPSASALAAIQQLGSTIREDVAAGQIRQDVGLDMDNLILPVMTQLASGQPAPVQQLVSTLRAKIATRLSEGGLTTQAANQLTSELGTLQSSAGGGS
jgi:eukaryotic-like serine/threonine-protein kinase